jgi:hypothetical protein
MVHPTHVLRPGGSPKHRALAYRSHRPCCPTPSAPFGCPTLRSQIAIEPAAPPDGSLPAIAARPLVNTASGTVRLGSTSVPGPGVDFDISATCPASQSRTWFASHRTRRTCSRSGLTLVSWDQEFFDPIILPGRKPLVTLRDAAQYITQLPKAEHDAEEWQPAFG